MTNQTKRPVSAGAEELIDAYFPVLDHGFISLKDYSGNDLTIEESARVSYGKETRHISDTRTLIRYLFSHRHMTPFEMPTLRFHMGLPIFVMRQLIRHRMASVNEYSGRYSVMPMLFYTPTNEQVCYQSKNNKQGRGANINEDHYGDFWRRLQTARGMVAGNYKRWIDEDDIARETARLDLPLSTYTYCYWKSDLRNIFNLMSLRSDPHAQWEIQQFSDVICGIVERFCPLAFEAFQDYQQGSVTFTQNELRVLPYAMVRSEDRDVEFIHEKLSMDGLTKREINDFWNKIKPIPKKNYTLDLANSKTGDYFMDMAINSAVEIPVDNEYKKNN